MKKILLMMLLLGAFAMFATVVEGQTRSVTGIVVDYWMNNKGTSEAINVKIGPKTYIVYITRPDLPQPKTIGKVTQVGSRARILHTGIVLEGEADGRLKATRIVEVKRTGTKK